jgi:hypothetical protein
MFEGGEHFRSYRFVENRSPRTLVHEAIGREGHDQHVAQAARSLQMTDVAQMYEVKRTMGLHYGQASFPLTLRDCGDFLDAFYFFTRICRKWPRRAKRID